MVRWGEPIYAAWLDQRKRFGGLNREEICGCAFKIHIPAEIREKEVNDVFS